MVWGFLKWFAWWGLMIGPAIVLLCWGLDRYHVVDWSSCVFGYLVGAGQVLWVQLLKRVFEQRRRARAGLQWADGRR